MFDQKLSIFFSCKFFPIFGHQNPGSVLVFSLKCWIRIWNQWILIRNTVSHSYFIIPALIEKFTTLLSWFLLCSTSHLLCRRMHRWVSSKKYSTGICPICMLFSLFSEHLEHRLKTKYDRIWFLHNFSWQSVKTQNFWFSRTLVLIIQKMLITFFLRHPHKNCRKNRVARVPIVMKIYINGEINIIRWTIKYKSQIHSC